MVSPLQVTITQQQKGGAAPLFCSHCPGDFSLMSLKVCSAFATNCLIFTVAAVFTGAAEDVVYRALALFPFEFFKTYFGKNRSNVGALVTEQV